MGSCFAKVTIGYYPALRGMDVMDNLFSIQKFGLSGQLDGTAQGTKVRTPPSWPRSWANFSLFNLTPFVP